MRGTFKNYRIRIRRGNWNRRKLARRSIWPDWYVRSPSDKNTMLHRLIWVNSDGSTEPPRHAS